MRTKILTFACILMAEMILGCGAVAVKAEEGSVATGAAVETEAVNQAGEETEEPSEYIDSEPEAEELEVEEDEVPLGEAEDKETISEKKADKKTVKKADKTVKKAAKTEKKKKSVIYDCTDEEFKILVCVTYLEAGNQPYKGKLATANVVMNRVLSKNFPNTIKGVIYQKYNGRYQFSLCSPGGKLEQALKVYGKRTGWAAKYEKECVKACRDALEGKTATDRKYHFFRLYYNGIENWKSDGVRIKATYFYNY